MPELAFAAPGDLASVETGRNILVKNTFLNFIEDQDDDPWMVDPSNCRRQQTDSIMYKASLNRRTSNPKLESVSSATTAEGWRIAGRASQEMLSSERSGRYMLEGSENDEALFEGINRAAKSVFHAPDAAAGAGGNVYQDSPIFPVPGGMGMNTTVMIRHVPIKYTQAKLMREINSAGFLGRFDFLYLPVDPRNKANRGFAFCNFDGPEMAELFYQTYHGKKLRRFDSDKAVEVLPADTQGFEKNAEQYVLARANGRIKSSHSRPLFLRALPANLASHACFHTETAAKGGKAPGQKAVLSKAVGAPQNRGSSQKAPSPGPAVIPMTVPDPAASINTNFASGTRVLAPVPAFDGVMRFCPYCGKPKQTDVSFCPYCGGQQPRNSQRSMEPGRQAF